MIEIRHWRDADADALSGAVAASADHLRPWMPWIKFEPKDAAARREWFRELERQRAAGGDELFGIFAGDEVVGGCGLHRRIGEGGREIGYWIAAARTRRGYATEAVRELLRLAFADASVDRVEIHHDRANVASGAIPAKLGFEHVDDRQREPEAPGEEGMLRVWRLTRAQWSARMSVR